MSRKGTRNYCSSLQVVIAQSQVRTCANKIRYWRLSLNSYNLRSFQLVFTSRGTCTLRRQKRRFIAGDKSSLHPNLQVLNTQASHVCSQHLLGLPPRMNWMRRTQFDHARLDLPSLVIWSGAFWPSVTWNLRKAHRTLKQKRCCRPHPVTFGYY